MPKAVLRVAAGCLLFWGIYSSIATGQGPLPEDNHLPPGLTAAAIGHRQGVGQTGAPLTPTESKNTERGEKISAVHILSLFTALILLFSFWINYNYHEQRTRPIIRFYISGAHRGLRITPILENSTNTDAVGLPVIELRVIIRTVADGGTGDAESAVKTTAADTREAKIIMDVPFTGTQVWYLPAKAKVSKSLSLKPFVDRMLRDMDHDADSPDFTYDVVLKTYIYYKRWMYPTEWWRWAWYGFRHALYFIQLRKIYVSPVRTWVYADYRWKFIPHIEQKEKPIKVDLGRLNIA